MSENTIEKVDEQIASETVENEVVEEIATADVSADESVATDEVTEGAKKKRKSLKDIIKYIKEHEDLRQAVMFFIFSIFCSVAQIATTYIVQILVDLSGADGFGWIMLPNGKYLFDWTSSLGSFVGFLVGSVVGQVLTFILNRKKTFKATNNVVISAIMYAIMAVIIIFIQTALSAINMPILAAVEEAGLPLATDGTFVGVVFGFVCTIPGLLAGGLTALVLSFFGSKYLVMRDWSKKKDTAEGESATVEIEGADEAVVEEAIEVIENAEAQGAEVEAVDVEITLAADQAAADTTDAE